MTTQTLSAGPERYQGGYEGIDDTRFEPQAAAVMPAYDLAAAAQHSLAHGFVLDRGKVSAAPLAR